MKARHALASHVSEQVVALPLTCGFALALACRQRNQDRRVGKSRRHELQELPAYVCKREVERLASVLRVCCALSFWKCLGKMRIAATHDISESWLAEVIPVTPVIMVV